MKRLIPLLLLAGCVFSPEGEDAERRRAREAFPGENPGGLAADATLEEILRHAYLSNAGLKERGWAWQAALEQIPQDASPGTTLALTYGQMFEDGKTSWGRTTFGAGNDPMANIPWPSKLSTAGRRALERARAEGRRFEGAVLDLRARTVKAWFDYALTAESLRLREEDTAFLDLLVGATEARVEAGQAPLEEALRVRTERDLAGDRAATLHHHLPGRRAAVNALLNREPAAPLDLPQAFPPPRPLRETDVDILALLAGRNPELGALAHEIRGGEEAVELMRLQYFPDFGLSASADAGGIARSLMAMITAPILRYPAIEASIAQARAEIEATRARRRQAELDLKAMAFHLLHDFRNAERAVELYRDALLPRADQVVEAARADYVAGKSALSGMLEAARMRIEIRLMLAEMRAEREKIVAELEALAAVEK